MNTDPHADYRRQAEQHFGETPADWAPASTVGAATSAYEHENIRLRSGEDTLFGADFTASPLLRHIKTGVVVTPDRVIVRDPQYMLFVIKVGHAETSIPIPHICNVTTGRQLSPRRVRFAALTAIVGMLVLTLAGGVGLGPVGLLLALVMFAFAAFQLWLARGLALVLSHPGGGTVRVDVDKLEYDEMLRLDRLIQRLVAEATRPAAVEAPAPPPVAAAPAPALAARPPAPQPAVRPAPQPAAATWSVPPRPRTPAPTPQGSAAPPTIWRDNQGS